jgi:hypothetical protein
MGFIAGQLYEITDEDFCARELAIAVDTLEKMNAQNEESIRQNKELSRISGLAIKHMEACQARCPETTVSDSSPEKSQ